MLLTAGLTYYLLFPRDSVIVFPRSDGSSVAFSRTDISFESAPDYFPTNGFDHIEPYIHRLLAPTKRYRSLHIFTPDGNRGLGLTARGTIVEANLIVELRQDVQREAAIRSFFRSLGATASEDYLAENGGVPDSTRILTYPLKGNTTELTTITKRILKELCNISPTEALNIQYDEK